MSPYYRSPPGFCNVFGHTGRVAYVPVVSVVGPTAAGKSDLAVALALEFGGEVVNADSMQLYRGMDIGTAKLRLDERRGVVHHLLDVLDVTEAATVAQFQSQARQVIDDCLARDVPPVVVGGSALYMRAVLDEFRFPGTDATLRARFEAELDSNGPREMHRRLAERDPAAAESILPTNGRRIVRALEVVELTGRPYTANLPEMRYHYDTAVQIGLDVPRSELDRRIERRVDLMWEAGFVDEVAALDRAGLRDGRTAGRALGYSQVLAYLAGEMTEQQARDETVRATRRFARRQDSWFRKDPRIRWIAYDAADLGDRAQSLIR